MIQILKDTALGFIDDEALSRGAAIAFYTVTSLAPVLLVVIAVAWGVVVQLYKKVGTVKGF